MATTTNYGWTTPDDTALVKDGASAIRTLGTSVDTTTKNLNPSTTLGDIEYRSSTANTNTRLGIGSTGNVLTVTGGVPVWAAPAGGGKVLQVVQATYATSTTTTTGSLVDTGLSATITPSSATSKVLVMVSQPMMFYASGYPRASGAFTILRTSTNLLTLGNAEIYGARATVDPGDAAELKAIYAYSYLDSPATTSATTYKTQFQSGTSSTAYANTSGSTSTMILMEIGA